MTTPDQVRAAWDRLPTWARNMLYALDKRVNAKKGGDPDMTVSERLALARNDGVWEGRLGCLLLDRYDPGHCDRAIRTRPTEEKLG